jgi:hypothetical protein
MGIVAAETIRSMSSSLILPFNCVTYAQQLIKEFEKFSSKYKSKLDELNIHIDNLNKTINDFLTAATKFHHRLELLDKTK